MSANTSLERLKILRRQYKLQMMGHREQIIKIFCEGYKQAVVIQKSNHRRKAFFALVGIRPSQQKKVNFVTEMMAYVISAKSDSKRKRAWKYGRACQYLAETGTRLIDLEAEIKKRGGLEAVAKEAAQQRPRRPKVALRSTTRAVPKLGLQNRSADIQLEKAASRKSENVVLELPNDQRASLLVEIKMSDLDELRELNPGAQIKLITTRLRDGRHLLRVNRVRRLR